MIIYTFIAIAILILAVVSAILLYLRSGKSKLAIASLEASRIKEEAKRDAENSRKAAEIAAKEHWYQEKVKFEKETASRRKEIERAEKRLSEKERVLDRHEHLIVDREKELMTMQRRLNYFRWMHPNLMTSRFLSYGIGQIRIRVCNCCINIYCLDEPKQRYYQSSSHAAVIYQ